MWRLMWIRSVSSLTCTQIINTLEQVTVILHFLKVSAVSKWMSGLSAARFLSGGSDWEVKTPSSDQETLKLNRAEPSLWLKQMRPVWRSLSILSFSYSVIQQQLPPARMLRLRPTVCSLIVFCLFVCTKTTGWILMKRVGRIAFCSRSG